MGMAQRAFYAINKNVSNTYYVPNTLLVTGDKKKFTELVFSDIKSHEY